MHKHWIFGERQWTGRFWVNVLKTIVFVSLGWTKLGECSAPPKHRFHKFKISLNQNDIFIIFRLYFELLKKLSGIRKELFIISILFQPSKMEENICNWGEIFAAMVEVLQRGKRVIVSRGRQVEHISIS